MNLNPSEVYDAKFIHISSLFMYKNYLIKNKGQQTIKLFQLQLIIFLTILLMIFSNNR